MKPFLSKVFFTLVLMWSFSASSEYAQLLHAPAVTHSVDVNAQVGQFYVSFSGFIAPYASVTMLIDDTIVRSTVADGNGYFYLSQVLVQSGFDHFCLDAIDVKRLGESEACFKVPPVYADYKKDNIFLPPTIGLYKKQINVGTDATVWGYSMPGAKVKVHISDGRVLEVTADATGYYEVKPPFNSAGDFQLFADATYNNKQSENPIKKVTLKAITTAQQVGQTIQQVGKNLWDLLAGPLGFILIAIPLIILIIILFKRLTAPKVGLSKLPGIGKEGHLPFDFLFKKRKLHHSWFVGY